MQEYVHMTTHVVTTLGILAVNQMNKVAKMKLVFLVRMNLARTQVIHNDSSKEEISALISNQLRPKT